MKRLIRKASNYITKHCAPYEVRCNYGTAVQVWTLSDGIEWLSACAEVAIIVHRATGSLVASRTL